MFIKEIETSVRRCGRRKAYGLYLTGGDDLSPDGTLLPFTKISPPIPYQVKFHRNLRLVDAVSVLSRMPMDQWWVGSSEKTEIKKSGDAWWVDVFGMTRRRRMSLGECVGATSGDQCMAILSEKIHWTSGLIDSFRSLTLTKISELPRLAASYEKLHVSLTAASRPTGNTNHLIEAQAAVWEMAFLIPPSKRSEYIPALVNVLAYLNLTKDAAAMARLFPRLSNADLS